MKPHLFRSGVRPGYWACVWGRRELVCVDGGERQRIVLPVLKSRVGYGLTKAEAMADLIKKESP